MLKQISLFVIVGFSIGTANADHRQYDMRVDGLTCPFCVATSSKALKRIEGVYEVTADLETAIISVCAASETDLGDDRMTELFRSKGYTYRSQTVSEGCTIADIAHSETGENITQHDHPHPAEADDALMEQEQEEHNHGGQGS